MRKLQALVILVILFVLAAPVQAQESINLRYLLDACWDLDEESGTRYDEAGANNLTDVNTVTRQLGVSGYTNYAANFVYANGEYLDAGNKLDYVNTDFTVMSWFTPKNQAYNYPGVIDNLQCSAQWCLDCYTSNRVIWAVAGNTQNDITISSPIPTWTMAIGWYNATTDLSGLLVNNSQSDAATTTATTTAYAGQVRIGVSFQGQIDTTAIWGRLLNDAEKDWLYNDGNGRSCDEILGRTDSDANYYVRLDLSSYERGRVYRELTFGDIAVVIAVLALFSLELVRLLFKLVQRNTREN